MLYKFSYLLCDYIYTSTYLIYQMHNHLLCVDHLLSRSVNKNHINGHLQHINCTFNRSSNSFQWFFYHIRDIPKVIPPIYFHVTITLLERESFQLQNRNFYVVTFLHFYQWYVIHMNNSQIFHVIEFLIILFHMVKKT